VKKVIHVFQKSAIIMRLKTTRIIASAPSARAYQVDVTTPAQVSLAEARGIFFDS